MNDNKDSTGPNDLSVVLAREEALVILRLLNVSTIPGLGDEPIPNLTDEQQAIGLIVAERTLRARGLATLNSEGRLLIQRPILEMLGTCAYADQSLHVTQMAAPAGGVMQLITHQRAGAWVLHTRPDEVLHAFQRLGGWTETLARLADLCRWPRESSGADIRLTVDARTLSAARDLAADGQLEQAEQQLIGDNNHPDAVKALVNLLAAPHLVTVVQRVRIESADSLSLQSVTVLHDDHELLVAVEPGRAGSDENGLITIQPTSMDELGRLLTGMVNS